MIAIHTPNVQIILIAYTGSTDTLFIIIPINARITTRAKIILYFLYIAISANNVATMITKTVQETSDIHRAFHHTFTRNAEIFAIIATDIHHKYKLNGI